MFGRGKVDCALPGPEWECCGRGVLCTQLHRKGLVGQVKQIQPLLCVDCDILICHILLEITRFFCVVHRYIQRLHAIFGEGHATAFALDLVTLLARDLGADHISGLFGGGIKHAVHHIDRARLHLQAAADTQLT